MTNFARIIDSVAVDVSTDPANHFAPSIAADFVSVPDQVQPQWRLASGKWAAPAPTAAPDLSPPAPAPEARDVSVRAFFSRFTSEERIAIIDRQAGDANVRDFVFLANASKFIDLDDESVGMGLAYLVHIGLLTVPRAQEVLSAEVTDAERP